MNNQDLRKDCLTLKNQLCCAFEALDSTSFAIKQIVPDDTKAAISLDKLPKPMFDFCKGKYEACSFIKIHSIQLAVTCFLGVILLLLSVIKLNMGASQLQKDVDTIDQKMTTMFRQIFPGVKKIQDPHRELTAKVLYLQKQQKDKGSKTSREQKIRAIDLLVTLSKKIPSAIDIALTRLALNDTRLIFSGSTDNFNSVDQIKSSLEKETLFKRINISSASLDQKTKRINFKFIIELRHDGFIAER